MGRVQEKGLRKESGKGSWHAEQRASLKGPLLSPVLFFSVTS